MRYIIKSKEVRDECMRELSKIRKEPLMQVIIEEYQDDRSAEQNAYLWGVVYPTIRNFILESTGDNFSCEYIHEWCKDEFINAEPKVVMGKFITVKSTKGNKKKFSEYLERIFHHFAELGCVIPDPEPSFIDQVKQEYPNSEVISD